MNDLEFLYTQTRAMRENLFTYFETLPFELLHQTHPAFGRGSLLETAAHVVDTYHFWVGEVGLEETPLELEIQPSDTVAVLRSAFAGVDALMARAFTHFTDLEREFEWTDAKGSLRLSKRWLLLHPLTHEFHHKGQMVSLGRALGNPVGPRFDTDLPPPGGW